MRMNQELMDFIQEIIYLKKKHDKILMLAESKLNSIETLMSQVLGDLDIRHEEFVIILKKKDRYEKMKYNLVSENEDKKQ